MLGMDPLSVALMALAAKSDTHTAPTRNGAAVRCGEGCLQCGRKRVNTYDYDGKWMCRQCIEQAAAMAEKGAGYAKE